MLKSKHNSPIIAVQFAFMLLGANVLSSCDAGMQDQLSESSGSSKLLDEPRLKSDAQSMFYREIPVVIDEVLAAQPDVRQIVNSWYHAFSRSWGQATGLTTTGWGLRTGGWQPNVLHAALYPSDCDAARTFPADDDTFEVMSICPSNKFNEMYLVHELGHVIGFDHEFERNDYPAITQASCPAMNAAKGSSTAFTENTKADPFSMMNSTFYCNTLMEPSYEDIVGAQNAWGFPNYFADVTGDGADDAIVVNPDGVWIIPNAGKQDSLGGHFKGAATYWGGHKGQLGTFFADVTGDGKADMIAIDTGAVRVSTSTGSAPFLADTVWINSPFSAVRGIELTDINGDGKADFVWNTRADFNVPDNACNFKVRYSNGSSFAGAGTCLANLPLPYAVGSHGWFADVTGPDSDQKSRADYIYYDNGGVWVAKNSPTGFKTPTLWLSMPTSWLGLPLLFADINGDGKKDFVGTLPSTSLVDPSQEIITIRLSNGSSFQSLATQLTSNRSIEKGVFAAKLSKTSAARTVGWVNRSSVYAWDYRNGQPIWDLTRRAYYGLR